MDKSLRKLSRVELLELMVAMSEDYEDLSAENDRLRKLLSQQRLSKNAKVGSIAEAALQANGYFEAAQRSADEYLREIKRLRDDMLARQRAGVGQMQAEARAQVQAQARAQAQEQAQAIIRDAHAQANRIVARAQAQAQAIAGDAQARAREEDARRQAQVQAQAQAQAQTRAHAQAARQDAMGYQAAPEHRYRGEVQRGRHSQAAQQMQGGRVFPHAAASSGSSAYQGASHGVDYDRARNAGHTVQMPSLDARLDAGDRRLSHGWTS